MPIRRMALAGMMAAFGAGSWFVVEHGPATVASAAAQDPRDAAPTASAGKSETAKAAIAKKGLAPAEQEALMGRVRTQYPQVARKLEAWTPVTAAKISALNEAYRSLGAAERQDIARDVSLWQRQVWKQYPAIRASWNTGGAERERAVAESALELASGERQQLDTSVTGLWKRIGTKNPKWVAWVEAIMSAR